MNNQNEIGHLGQKIVENWLSRHKFRYMPTSYLMWDDSLVSYFSLSTRDLARGEFNRVKDDMRSRVNGIISVPYDEIRRYNRRIKKTRSFFAYKRLEEKIAKALMREAENVQWEANRHVSPQNHHTAMMPDYFVRMPNLTFLEVKTNGSKLEPNQRLFFNLAKRYGFSCKVVRVLASNQQEHVEKIMEY